ncbi:MAG: hypothetical protein IK137_04195 [Bacilli bacterium]|nr:hypothetical protein [Bacilli bacterium]
MNKKVSLNLNIIEVSSFVLSLLFMGIYLMPSNVVLVRPLLFLLGSVCGLTFISIELFLILIMNNKYRIIYISYILLSLILGILINTKLPYSVFLVIAISSILKGLFKVLLSDKIYLGSRYKKYSKIFITEYKELKTNINKLFNRKKVLVPVTNKKKVRSKGYAQKDLV